MFKRLRFISVVTALALLSLLASPTTAAEPQAPIKPLDDGSFLLPPQAAALRGSSVQLDDKTKSLTGWSHQRDQANWKVNNPKMGNFDVFVTWAVSDQDAAQGYKIDIDHRSTIRAFTVSTGGADKFKREVVGRIMLASGVHDVTFYPSSRDLRAELCKLQRIELVPVENVTSNVPQEPVELHVPAGFEVERVAGFPLTKHPMLGAFDERGRLYVAESTGVNADGSVLAQSPPHEIRVLEDIDGDGKFDKFTVFADKLTFPQGIVWHEGSIYISSPPHFWRLTDTDGDNVADQREVLATGFPFRGMSDDMHGATVGRDGRLYFAAGRFRHKIRRPDGPVIHQGHNPLIVRCRPDGSELEVYSGAMGNAVGVDFSESGDCFASGTFGINAPGKRDVLNHCVEGGVYPVLGQAVTEHKWTGGELPNLAQFGATASSDIVLYRGAHFGSEYEGNLFSALFNLHQVARHVLEPNGATYDCRTEEFLTSPNADFHPTDVFEDADGSLIIIDTGAWFLIGCPTSVIAKPQINGGIYRIRRTGTETLTDPRGLKIAWKTLQPEQLVKLLDDPRFVVRDRAIQAVADYGKLGVPALRAALQSTSSQVRLNATWALSRMDGPEAAEAAQIALSDADPSVRQAAATAAGLFRDRDAVVKLTQLVREDESLPVRREAAGALGRIGDRTAVESLLDSLAASSDRFLDHAIILALIRIDDREQTLPGLVHSSAKARRGALIALDQMNHGGLLKEDVIRALEIADAPLQQIALEVMTRRSGWTDQIVELASQWLRENELTAERRAALRSVLLALAKDASVQQLIAQTLTAQSTPFWAKLLMLDVMGQSALDTLPALWQPLLLASLASDNAELAREAVTAISAVNRARREVNPFGQAELDAVARDASRPMDLRVAAAASALSAEQPIPGELFDLLVSQCGPDVEPVSRLTAATAIGASKLDTRQCDRVIDLLAGAGPLEMPALIRGLESADARFDTRLVESLEKSPGLSAISPDRLAKLVEKMPTEVRAAGKNLLQRNRADLEAQRQRLEELKDVLVDGDAERGRKLFFGTKATCSACHRIGTEGNNIGPNLAGIGQIRTRRDLLEAVVFPSASFARDFESFNVTTTSGIQRSGILSRTTGDALYLTTAERITYRIPRSEIEPDGIEPATISIMPQGFDRILTKEELRDLLTFLSSQKQ